jgi:hypothetical protein
MPRAFLPLLCLLAAACSQDGKDPAADAAVIAQDPVLARALHDPLMSDPDLASRNEANAAIGFADSSALPVIAATTERTEAAREAARLELLEGGAIPDLPAPRKDARGKPLGPMAGRDDLLAAIGAPAGCAGRLREDYALAAALPAPAVLPPLAMVVQAGGSDAPGCRIRIIRYHTAAAPQDVLQYHYVTATRAGFTATRYAAPEDILAARDTGGQVLLIHVRPGPHGLSAATLLWRAP